VVVLPVVLLIGPYLAALWQTWMLVGVVAVVAGLVEVIPWLQQRNR
jgi:uncharacterized membrane protein HdeD (DUF308 family)